MERFTLAVAGFLLVISKGYRIWKLDEIDGPN